jgi:hypothetical protein
MIGTTPMAVGIAGSLVIVGVAIFTLPSNARRVDRLLEAPRGVVERAVGVVLMGSVMVWYAAYVSLTPPTVFNFAVVRLDDARHVAGAYIGRSEGAVVLARCDASLATVQGVPRRGAFSRNARFLSVPVRRIRWVRVTNRSYVFDPGRSRTVLGALVAVTDIGPHVGLNAPWTTSTDITADKPVCGGG